MVSVLVYLGRTPGLAIGHVAVIVGAVVVRDPPHSKGENASLILLAPSVFWIRTGAAVGK